MSLDSPHLFEVTDEVRDNEADLAGVVNHAHYLNYMANARHKHLRTLGLDFQDMLNQGLMLVATKIEIKYRLPLFIGNAYVVQSELTELRSKVFNFSHKVLLLPERRLVSTAVVQVACVDCETNKASMPPSLHDRIHSVLTKRSNESASLA